MNNDKASEMVRRWHSLVTRKKTLDWDITCFAAELRSEFEEGVVGEKALTKWCEHELEMPTYVAQELLLRALAHNIVGRRQTYERIGGFAAVRQVIGLDKRQRTHVIQSAMAQDKSVRSAMRDQGLLPPPPEPAENPDVLVLIEFVTSLGIKIPSKVERVCKKYQKKETRLKAA